MNVAGISSTLSSSGDVASMQRTLKPKAEQAKQAAAQFEAILVRQFLNDSVSSLVGKNDAGGGVYGYFLTDTLAQNLTAKGGLGLSNVIERQLNPQSRIATDHQTK